MKVQLALVAALFTAASSFAVVDPDLLVLEAKVDALAATLGISRTQLDLYLAQRADHDATDEVMLEQLNQARQLDWEQVLLECATNPGICVMPQIFTSFALVVECTELDEAPGHPEEASYGCALREILQLVRSDIEAVERQGLPRDIATARTELDSAVAAATAGDAESAFWSACAAFKAIACRLP
jgi:hypothetical protein